ncbi:Zn-dependent protease with chaperone function [Methanohalophilus levihalophilus]|uniref:M48 family metalloprotease n=1 Tax=Methanohalophilus levihalophilus TaxID=1431282 RepID=UPI001AE299B0|nr:M48 family metalloprotease [Methanohalophilus levihalophilus]MBP2029459.1 Zn-dependent protease with chaperone function [Methanohalophilus levihalophilus]
MPGSSKNKVKIFFLFALPSLVVVAISWFLGGNNGLIGSLIAVFLLSLIFYFLGARVLLRWYHSKKVQSTEYDEIRSILRNLADMAGVNEPDLYVFDSDLPLLFTVGTRKKNVSISSSAIEVFDSEELEVLLAREIGHIKNDAVSLNTIVALFAGIISAFSTLALWGALLGGFGQDYDPAPKLIRLIAMGIAAPPAALLVQLGTPREAESLADNVAMDMTKNPNALGAALSKVESFVDDLENVRLNPGHSHLFSVNPLKVRDIFNVHLSMFNTHLDLDTRKQNILSYSS